MNLKYKQHIRNNFGFVINKKNILNYTIHTQIGFSPINLASGLRKYDYYAINFLWWDKSIFTNAIINHPIGIKIAK